MKRMISRLPNLMVEKNPRLTQRQLAIEVGVSLTTVAKLYNGQPLTMRIDPETIEKVCNYFKCGVGDLFWLEEVESCVLNSRQLRPFGLATGEVAVPDDFDAPLPEDILSEYKNEPLSSDK